MGLHTCRCFLAMLLLAVSVSGPAQSREFLDAEVTVAKANLKASQQTARRARREYEALQGSPSASDEEIDNYRKYVLKLGKIVEENRRALELLLALYREQEPPPDQPTPQMPTAQPAAVAPEEQTDEERVADMERKLDGSMAEFDGMLLKEMRDLEEKREQAQSGGEFESGGGSGGEDGDGDDARTGSGDSDEEGARVAKAGENAAEGDEDAQGSEGEGSYGGKGSRGGAVPPNIPDGSDDDVIARQLREAAESETNPALKERLWEEYRNYKKNG